MFLGKLLNLNNASFLSLYNLFLLPGEENLLPVIYYLCYIFTLPFVLCLGSLTYLYSFGNSVFFFFMGFILRRAIYLLVLFCF